MLLRVVIFLILNFSALAIGGFFTGAGVPSEWYAELNKAPWTPPGWVFGAAWTTIMVCYSIFMAFLWKQLPNKKWLITLYAFQWILNVSWNPAFFYAHQVALGLLLITSLTLLIGYYFFGHIEKLKWKTIFVLPYLVWLLIATSLNGYILMYN
ncbi:tryptophan-rich sensory protein [Flammeovirga sp. MY04]|uniref:TspO/MBR family protein n=1 Tax=Flammeovirga sp. MY04 TaxID=1191459 RepID=UPI0008061396|nr:TspO/MBR family protein [Flammeovirga sp. MY04]ANQ51505.1 tryptophan-rich sensory protein [Flammeovirga sp. MY04]